MSKKKKGPVLTTNPAVKAPPVHTGTSSRYFILLLLGVSFIVLFPCLHNGFINFDDPQYVMENPVIRQLDKDNLKKMFTSSFVGNYQPLTMLSYALEYHFFKLDPFPYHLVNLLLHLINTVLVFSICFKLINKKPLPAFITAFLFAIHPMHVESVAWISERKDVLYGLFFLCSIYFYLQHANRKDETAKYYWLSLLFFVVSLFSKAQAVVLPVVLLIIDYFLQRKFNKKLVIEKVPFFILAISFGLLAVSIQRSAGAVQDYAFFKFYERILLSCYALGMYFVKLLVPVKLSCFYPYPDSGGKITSMWVYISPVLLLISGGLVIKYLRNSRPFIFGLLFFLVTIALLLQLIPVGDAIIADRYTYIPSIGLFFIAAYYFEVLRGQYFPKLKKYVPLISALGIFYLLALSVSAFNRSKLWNNSITLYSDALKNYPAPIIYNNRGVAYSDKNLNELALADFTKVLAINPRFPNGYKNRAATYERIGDTLQAIRDYTQAVNYFPRDEKNYIQRGNLYKAANKFDLAIADYTKVAALIPAHPDVYLSRAELYGRSGRYAEALADIDRALAIKPDLAGAYNNRGIVNGFLTNNDQAVNDFSRAIQLDPEFWNAYMNRSIANKSRKNYEAALQDALTARKNGHPVSDSYLDELSQLLKGKQVK